MKKAFLSASILLLLAGPLLAREYHVSPRGDDNAPGTAERPLKTISRAAFLARPGDVVIVHQGVYREKVVPSRGGTSNEKRIVYTAAPGEKVVIKGSEVVKGWKRFHGNTWRIVLPGSFFKEGNPFKDILHGDWFNDRGWTHHRGEVFLNGRSLYESPTLEGVLDPRPNPHSLDKEASTWTWFCETRGKETIVYANFHGLDPERETVEITLRDSCFYPARPGVNYITVRGFHMSQAATQWAPPTAEQIGLIGTRWSKGWIIEDNVVSDSKCVGIALGKDRRTGQNVWSRNPCKSGATHYNEVIFRALRAGWSKEKIGSHIVRNNTILRCGQAGIVGSLGAVFSLIEGNHIHHIWTKRLFSGAEIAGIKIHAAVDVVLRRNRIHHAGRGIWLDWMAQGTRVTRNLLYENSLEDLFTEVSHGPYMVDDNLFLSGHSLRNWSEGGAFVHNLFAGAITVSEVLSRYTPYLFPHSTAVAGLRNVHGGEVRFFNNLFAGAAGSRGGKKNRGPVYGLEVYDRRDFSLRLEGNVYLGAARPWKMEPNCLVLEGFDPKIGIREEGEAVYLSLVFPSLPESFTTRPVTPALLGRTRITGLPFEDPSGRPLSIDTDYLGRPRKGPHPTPGPFEIPEAGNLRLRVW